MCLSRHIDIRNELLIHSKLLFSRILQSIQLPCFHVLQVMERHFCLAPGVREDGILWDVVSVELGELDWWRCLGGAWPRDRVWDGLR